METDSGRGRKTLTGKRLLVIQRALASQVPARQLDNSPSSVPLFEDQDCIFRKIAFAPKPVLHRNAKAL